MQCACAILSSMACPAVHLFLYYLINGTIFGKKKVIEHKMCISIFSINLSAIFLIKRRIDLGIIINVYRSSCRVTLLLSQVNKTSIFWTDFRKKQSKITFRESPSIESRIFPCGRTDRRGDTKKLIVALRNFANAPNEGGSK